jgi:hypothetical protein
MNHPKMEASPAYQPVCRDEEDSAVAGLEEKEGISWDSNSTEIIPTNTRSFVAYLSLLLLSLSANILLVMDNARLRILHAPAKSEYSRYWYEIFDVCSRLLRRTDP